MPAWTPILVGLLFAALPALAGKPELHGAWELNRTNSQQIAEAAQKAKKTRGWGHRRGSMGVGRSLDRFEESIQAMTIDQGESRLTIVYADGRERVLHTDGRKQEREEGVGPVSVQASYNGQKLVCKMVTESGGTITEVFERRSDDPHLYVEMTQKGQGRKIKYTRVYDPAAGEDDGPN